MPTTLKAKMSQSVSEKAMKRASALFVSAILVALSALARGGGRDDMPKLLRQIVHGHDAVQFVSAGEALTPTGEPRPEYFPPAVAETVKEILNQKPENGCIRYGEVWIDRVNVPLRESVNEGLRTADYVVEGVVTGRVYGFRAGEPGQLLRVSQLRALLGALPEAKELYVFYPVGTFRAGDQLICKTDWRYGDPPADGDRAVVFALPNQTFGQFVDIVDEAGFIRVQKDGSLNLPQRFNAETAPRSIDALRRVIEKQLFQKE